MAKSQILVAALLFFIGVLGYFISSLKSPTPAPEQVDKTLTIESSEECIPTFRDGGGPYYQLNSPFREKIVPDINNGERLIVSGKILRNDCKTLVPNAVLDIWQANESGRYEDTWYRGRVTSDKDGNYKFETVVPKGYGEGTGYRPPHIHFKVFVSNQEVVTSQMFFPEVKGAPGFEDAFIMKIESTEENGKVVHFGNHNIILP